MRARFVTSFGIAIAAVATITYFSELKIWFVNPYIFLLIGIAFGYMAFLNWFTQIKDTDPLKQPLPTTASYLFLASFAYIVLSGLNIFQIEFLEPFDTAIALVAFASSFFIFFANRERLNNLEQESLREKQKEQGRSGNFGNKFPNINRVPILRNIVRWFYIEGWFYSIGLVILIITSIFVLGYRVGSHDLREDEFQVVGAAAGYYYTGTFYEWDWLQQKSGQYTSCLATDIDCNYTRAWPHTLLIALSYKIFGISEWSSRIVSVLFGVFFASVVYFAARYFTGFKHIALLATTAAIFNPAFINLFRYTRMYAVLLPIFLLLFYIFYKLIIEKSEINLGLTTLNTVINKHFNFNYLLLPFVVLLLIANYFIHVNSLIVFPIILAFIIYLAIARQENRYINVSIIGVCACLGVYLLYNLGIINAFDGLLSFFGKSNHQYIGYLITYPFSETAGVILLTSGLPLIYALTRTFRDRFVYLYLAVAVSLVFFIWVADRYAGYVYISHIVPIAVILITGVYGYIVLLIKNKAVKLLALTSFVLIVLLNFYSSADDIYTTNNDYGSFKEAYVVIKRNFNPSKDVLFEQYLRSYYLREIGGEYLRTVSMLSNKQYEFDTFLNDLSKYDSGWITWETRKSYHIQPAIIDYIDENFDKYHGDGVDQTNVEVYHFDQSMVTKSFSPIDEAN